MDGWVGWGGGSKGRPALGARGCLHDNPSSDGAAQWHMNAALHNAVSRWSGLPYCSCTCVWASRANCTTQDWSFIGGASLESLLFWSRLKPMYLDTHDMVYNTSQSARWKDGQTIHLLTSFCPAHPHSTSVYVMLSP